MRRIQLTTNGTGQSRVATPDYAIAPFEVGIHVAVTGTVSVAVEITGDDPLGTITNWVPVTGMTAITATGVYRLDTPCTGIRINQASGAGSTVVSLIQSGSF